MSRPRSGFRLSIVVSLAAMVSTLGAPALGGDGSLTYRKVALTGEDAPGTEPGTRFAVFTTGLNHSIMVPRIDEAGRVAFIALLDGIGVDETNRSGIWGESGGPLSLLVRTGMQAPGTSAGVVFAGVPNEYLPFPPDFSGGRALFQGVVAGPGVDSGNDDGLWLAGAGGVVLVGRERDPAPGMAPGVRFGSLFGSVDPQGASGISVTLSGTGVTTSNNDAIWSDRTGALASILREGDPAPGTASGAVFGSGNLGTAYTFPRLAFNDSSALAVQANLVGPGVDEYNDECVYVERDGELVLVARDGDDAPGVENPGPGPATGTIGGGSVVAGFYTVVHNDQGHVAFTARVGGSNWSTSVIYSDRTGTLWPVARPGDPAPGTGESFTLLGNPQLNDAGRIAFSASVETGPYPPIGIFWDQPGALAPLALPGQELAGMTVTGTSGIVGFNAAGDLAFRAGFEHPTQGFKSGLVLADAQGTSRLVAATSDLFDVHGDGSDLRQIQRVEPGGLSENGSVVFRLDFTDGSSGHFTASASAGPSEPGSVSGLRVTKEAGGELELSWEPDCGGGAVYSVYRGDLAQGLGSLAPESGQCAVAGTAATIPLGPGSGDFFLVVPNTGTWEGSYGSSSAGAPRPQAADACLPQGEIADCTP